MKTERNGILETAWREIKQFLKSYPGSLHCEFICLLIYFVAFICCAAVAATTYFDFIDYLSLDVQSIASTSCSFTFCCGFFCNFVLDSILNLVFFLPFKRKSSAEADKNKNENKE